MGISTLFQRYPLLLPTISLITGICFGKKIFFSGWILFSHSGLLLCLLFLLFILLAYSFVKYSERWIYGFLICLFFIALGVTLSLLHLERTKATFSSVRTCYKIRLISAVVETEKTHKAEALLLAEGDTVGLEPIKTNRIQLFFEKDSLLQRLNCDDELLIYTRIKPPVSATNYEAFDYARYLIYQGFSGIGYVNKGNWIKLEIPEKHSLKYRSLTCQKKVVNLYKKWNLKADAYALLSALTMGYKVDLTPDLRTSFSSAGVGHVLALSGLHIGFIALFFNFFIVRISRNSQFLDVFCRFILILMLWSFSFVVGSTSSVIRSVFMFSLLTFSSFFLRKSNSKQNLCITLFIMLLYNPLWLFDVGFQLSFMAVLSIITLLPMIQGKISFCSKVISFFWNIGLLSMVAQLGVLPLILYYFRVFPLYFLFGNLLIVPLVTLTIYLTFLGLITFSLPFINISLVYLLDKTLNLLLLLVKGIEQLPHSTINHIWISSTDVFLLFLVLLLFTLLLHKPKFQFMVVFLSSILLFLSVHFYDYHTTALKNSVVFYSVKNCPAIHCIDSNRKSYLTLIDKDSNPEKLFNTMDRYWSHYRLQLQCIKDSCHQACFFYDKPLLVFHNYKVAVIDTVFYCRKQTDSPLKVNLIYLCRGFRGSLTDVLSVFSSSTIVVDSSLPYYLQNRLEAESKERRIQCISLSVKGSYTFSL
ncbi:MAG: ComEC family competence protein [Bacteroidales bacterium]|nr:ComEC family competence protein [Bacteroidales bacterium]